jgi:membrane dipeptidase
LAAAAGFALTACAGRAAQPQRPRFVDGLLSSLPETSAQISRSGLDAFICDVADVEEVRGQDGTVRYVRDFAVCDRALSAARAHIRDRLSGAYVAVRGSDVTRRAGTGIFLQFQSCEPIGADLSRIGYFHANGLRVLQITHHHDNLFGGGSIELSPTGLSPLGIEGVAEMGRLRIVADISHASEQTALDVARHTRRPFILSLGACRAIIDHPRCVSDAVIRAIADRGGVMGIFMMSFWLTTAEVPTIGHYLAQIRHVIDVGGIETVGIANDFAIAGEPDLLALGNDNAEGVKGYHGWWRPLQALGMPGFAQLPKHVVIPELNTIDRMALICTGLERGGFSAGQIEKIMGGNWIRVLTDVLG